MTLEFIDKSINKKIEESESIIKYTFYELRVKNNLTEAETYNFLALVKTRLENLNYKVYRTNQKYTYNNKDYIVESNELMIGIKNNI